MMILRFVAEAAWNAVHTGGQMEPLESREIRYENILLATDFTPASDAAMRYGLAIARRFRSRVFLAHVVNPFRLSAEAEQRAINDAWRSAQEEMTNQVIAGRLEGIENHVMVAKGDTWEVLSQMIRQYSIDLLVAGTRGRSGLWKVLMGSTAEQVFRRAPCPVLTIGPNVPVEPSGHSPQRILFSTGFMAQSLFAGIYALSLAEQFGAELGLMHVVKNVPPGQSREDAQEYAEQKLRELIPAGHKLPKPPATFVAFGEPGECILKIAEEWKPELIVLGIRHPEADGRQVARATAYKVVTNAGCPVLTVRNLNV
jgi:nucleotide-binding universal stress UspA family protein